VTDSNAPRSVLWRADVPLTNFGHFPAAALDQLIASARAVDIAAVKKHLAREAAAG
jgi:hypothetical protein